MYCRICRTLSPIFCEDTRTFIDSVNAAEIFREWWYKDDPTHVNFFCTRSILMLAEIGDFMGSIYDPNAFVLKRMHG